MKQFILLGILYKKCVGIVKKQLREKLHYKFNARIGTKTFPKIKKNENKNRL